MRLKFHRLQIRTGIRLGERHCPGIFPGGEAGQKFEVLFFRAEFMNGFTDVLQTEKVHERGIGAGDHFDGHHVNSGWEIQPAIFSRERHAHQFRLGKPLERFPGAPRVSDLAIFKDTSFLINTARPGRNKIPCNITGNFQHLPVIVQRIGIIYRRIIEFFCLFIAILQYIDNFLNIQIFELKAHIRIFCEKIRHFILYRNLCLNTSINLGITSFTSPTMP